MGRKLKNDYTGKICGCWQVFERDYHPASKSHETFWKCECIRCGAPASVRKTDLDKEPRSCNNCKGDVISEVFRDKFSDSVWQIGDKYGLLTIIGKGKQNNNHHTYVEVQCDCGSDPFEVRLAHLKGQHHGRTISCGCVSESSGEIKIRQILEQMDINFQKQYRIKNENNEVMIFDFLVFENQKPIVAIEYDGEQHFKAIDFFGGEEAFKKQQLRDARKTAYCNTYGIKLIRIPYYDYDLINPEYLNKKIFLDAE